MKHIGGVVKLDATFLPGALVQSQQALQLLIAENRASPEAAAKLKTLLQVARPPPAPGWRWS
jgi:hypothetical protein